MLTVENVSAHFDLSRETVRALVRSGSLRATRVGRQFRFDWPDVWACEGGPPPDAASEARFQEDLLSKQSVAHALDLSERTVERWIAQGMPTRNVGSSVRLNPHDVTDWLRENRISSGLSPNWWRSS